MKKKIKIIKNKYGNIVKLFQNKNAEKIKEIYISEILYKKTKGWNFHKRSTSTLLVIKGKVKFNITKDFKKIKKITVDEKNYYFLVIKPNHWFSFEGMLKKNRIINFSNIKYDKSETKKKPIE